MVIRNELDIIIRSIDHRYEKMNYIVKLGGEVNGLLARSNIVVIHYLIHPLSERWARKGGL